MLYALMRDADGEEACRGDTDYTKLASLVLNNEEASQATSTKAAHPTVSSAQTVRQRSQVAAQSQPGFALALLRSRLADHRSIPSRLTSTSCTYFSLKLALRLSALGRRHFTESVEETTMTSAIRACSAVLESSLSIFLTCPRCCLRK